MIIFISSIMTVPTINPVFNSKFTYTTILKRQTIMVTKKKAPLPKLSKVICDKIRMTFALRGFSTLISNQQFNQLYHFYHSKKPHHPSQIRMFCKGHGSYRAMYDSSQVMVISKPGNVEPVARLFFKPTLHLDFNANY